MKIRWRSLLCLSLAMGGAVTCTLAAEAERRSGTLFAPSDVGTTTFEDKRKVKKKIKVVDVPVQCYNGVAGVATTIKSGDTVFLNFSEKIKAEKRS